MVPTDVRHGAAASSKVFRLYGRIGRSAVGALIPQILDVFSLQRRIAAGDGCLIAAGNIVIDGKGHICDRAAGGRRLGRGAVDRRVALGRIAVCCTGALNCIPRHIAALGCIGGDISPGCLIGGIAPGGDIAGWRFVSGDIIAGLAA